MNNEIDKIVNSKSTLVTTGLDTGLAFFGVPIPAATIIKSFLDLATASKSKTFQENYKILLENLDQASTEEKENLINLIISDNDFVKVLELILKQLIDFDAATKARINATALIYFIRGKISKDNLIELVEALEKIKIKDLYELYRVYPDSCKELEGKLSSRVLYLFLTTGLIENKLTSQSLNPVMDHNTGILSFNNDLAKFESSLTMAGEAIMTIFIEVISNNGIS